jgi:hypothetical protein
VADALSRRAYGSAELSFLSAPVPQWLLLVQASYDADDKAKELLTQLALDANAVPHFTLKNGILRYKSSVWDGNDAALHK